VLWIALVVTVALAAGVGAERRAGARAGRLARTILKVLLFGLTPFVYFFNVARLEISADVGAWLAIGWTALLLSALVAWIVGRRLLTLERPTAGVLSIVAMQGNTGLLGVAVVAAVLGFDKVPIAVLYDSLVQAPIFFLGSFAVAAATGTRAGEGVGARVRAFFLRNPPLWAVVAGLLAPEALAPDLLVEISRIMILNVFFLVIGLFLHSAAAIILVVPVVLPLINAVGIDPVHFGLIVTLNLAIGQQTPPVASVLITACSIARANIWDVSKANIGFVLVLLFVLLLCTYVEPIPMFLVEAVYR
jgi:predicted permease